MSDLVPCADCGGVGSFAAMVDGTRNGRRAGWRTSIACTTCAGQGQIERERVAWIVEGRRLRNLRKDRRMASPDAATALGLDLRTLLACEDGRIDPAPLTAAAHRHGWG